MKVLVQSKFKEVRSITKRDYVVEVDEDGKEKVVEVHGFRQFIDHRCFMTPEEAKFLVEDEANQRRAEVEGSAWYWYPAGVALEVPDNAQGHELTPPLPSDQSGLVDPLVAKHAEKQKQRREEALRKHREANKAAKNAASAE